MPYTIDDGNGGQGSSSVTIAITDTDPVVVDDTANTDAGVPTTGNVLANGSDENPLDTLTILDPATGVAATGPVTITSDNGATIVMNPDGSYEYTPAPGYAGVDNFEYTVVDSFGKTDTASVAVTVRGVGEWSVEGPSEIEEGSTAPFTVSLSGNYGEGEVVTIDLGFDGSTDDEDHASIIAAIQAAADANPDVTYDPVAGTLTFTAPADGASMEDLIINVEITDDNLLEGAEDMNFSLSNPGSSSGGVELDQDNAGVTAVLTDSEIRDTPAVWTIAGPAVIDEGADPVYTVSLDGDFGSQEMVAVEISIRDIDTNSADYGDFVQSVQTAADNHPHVTFTPADTSQNLLTRVVQMLRRNDASTGIAGTLEFTAPENGAVMDDLHIAVPISIDGVYEGVEFYAIDIANASSLTGITVGIDNPTVVTRIVDGEEPPLAPALPPAVSFVIEEDDKPEPIPVNYDKFFLEVPNDLIVGAMVEDLKSLNSNDNIQQKQIDQEQPIDSHDLEEQTVVVDGSEGFSSGKGYRGTHSVDPTDECGRFFIDSIIQEDVLSVIARSTIDPELSVGVVGFSVAMPDGSALPEWISVLADDEYLINRTVDQEVVTLAITAHREDGTHLVRVVEISLSSGEIRDLSGDSSFGLNADGVLVSAPDPEQ